MLLLRREQPHACCGHEAHRRCTMQPGGHMAARKIQQRLQRGRCCCWISCVRAEAGLQLQLGFRQVNVWVGVGVAGLGGAEYVHACASAAGVQEDHEAWLVDLC